jgi:hypothetical protein
MTPFQHSLGEVSQLEIAEGSDVDVNYRLDYKSLGFGKDAFDWGGRSTGHVNPIGGSLLSSGCWAITVHEVNSSDT